jgi:hypothetical protein
MASFSFKKHSMPARPTLQQPAERLAVTKIERWGRQALVCPPLK